MKEMEGMKEAFNIFVDSCEKAGVKFSKDNKQVEEWPNVGDDYWYFVVELDMVSSTIWKGDTEDLNIIKNLPIFKSETQAEKYYSIIDTINNIVDELGRPTWGDFGERDRFLYTIMFLTHSISFNSHRCSLAYQQNTFFPWCKKEYIEPLLEKVSESDLFWAFKKSMRII